MARHALIVFCALITASSIACGDSERTRRQGSDTGADDTSPDSQAPDTVVDVEVEAPDETGQTDPFLVIAPGTVAQGVWSTSAVCASCHSASAGSVALRDQAGRDVSPLELWQSSMKANAARDPFFRATLSAERARFPDHRAAIEEKCLTCHAPLGALEARERGELIEVADLATATTRGLLAADGVTCMACHTIAPSNQGQPETWSARQTYDLSGRVFGPHAAPFSQPMMNRTGLTPTASGQVREATLCASCHTLTTHALDLEGAPEFPEQTPWLEWRNSDFANPSATVTCQDCHMPVVDEDGQTIETRIARRPDGADFPQIAPRAPFGRHLFVGGNTLIPEVLKRFRAELRPGASDAAFDETIRHTREQLEQRTARLTLEEVRLDSGRLVGALRVDNLTGHKLPTGYPSRRMWLHLRVLDSSGEVLVEVGGWDGRGRILDGRGAPLASELRAGPVVPHRNVVRGEDEVVVWETVIGNREGRPDIGLMAAVSYLKDTRLLPAGWSSDGFEAARTRPVGVADDGDFVAGGDRVTLELPISGEAARLEVQIAYQVVGARWLDELFAADTPEVRALERMLGEVPNAPVILAYAEVDLR